MTVADDGALTVDELKDRMASGESLHSVLESKGFEFLTSGRWWHQDQCPTCNGSIEFDPDNWTWVHFRRDGRGPLIPQPDHETLPVPERAPIDTDPVGRPVSSRGDQQWPERAR